MTDEEKKAIEANAQAIALEEAKKKVEQDAQPTPEQKRIAELETEQTIILEREANYKKAYLKEVEKNKSLGLPEESDEDRIRRITREELAQTRINEIDSEKESLYKKTLKENQELKLAIQNKAPNISTGSGGSTENAVVTSTLITPEQLAHFKSRGWTDADIERYKTNLRKRV